ncbi:unnamed protein product [Ilex paraguariensis]|uniref:DNA-3-methyladenine glycosylase I n=1 Tax=Ilex paraguariensis TaxID=185542 RepID=A0ABC8U9V7_9AQUA
MSVATQLRSPIQPSSETRAILGPAGNRDRVSEEQKRKKEGFKKPKKLVSETPQAVVQKSVSVDSLCTSSDSSCSGSSAKNVRSKRRVKNTDLKPAKIVPDGVESVKISPIVPIEIKRCDWITANSDPLYTTFHDEEWGVPVHDDRKLFELLVLSQALAEHTWPAILTKRDTFRKLFDNFEPSSIAKFTEKKLLILGGNHNTLLSEQKFRAIVENANQLLKVQQEYGSFNNYCWHFLDHKPVRNGFRYARHVPSKTPKSELISKDLMRRGFCCVGPTVVYSFMQVAGMVNDHILNCFRYNDCNSNVKNDLKPKFGEIEVPAEAVESRHLSHD